MQIEDIPMVRLTWLDAQDSDGSWTDIEDIIAHEPAICQEIGWLVHRDSNKVIVMRSRIVTEDDTLKEGGGHIAIPTSWVLKIEELIFNEEINNTDSLYSYQSARTS
jgi:hypothetical protein|tara:strand:+ start:209 stop:529 length:321 start_codon:yes stop_codon:yes gene_type:complete